MKEGRKEEKRNEAEGIEHGRDEERKTEKEGRIKESSLGGNEC